MFRVATLLILVAALLFLLWALQRRLIYFPFGAVPSPDEVGLAGAEAVTFTTEDALTLSAWFVPADARTPGLHRANASRGRATVLLFNGNAGNRALRAPLAAALSARGIATLLVDYRGYGGNSGAPSEPGLARDARAARNYIAARPDVDPGRIVYFGESLGSGVAVSLAVERPPFALILRSPFTSLVDIGRHHYPFLPVRLLLRDTFRSFDLMPRLASPLLVIAGTNDTIVPAVQSERLFGAAKVSPRRLVMIDDADHNDVELLAGRRVIDAIVEFLDELSR